MKRLPTVGNIQLVENPDSSAKILRSFTTIFKDQLHRLHCTFQHTMRKRSNRRGKNFF